MKVLIADDHQLVRMALKLLLLESFPEADIHEAVDATELFKKATKEKWSIIISDISFPGQSGLDVLKQIKIHAPTAHVLMLSMLPAQEYAIRCISAGASGYLTKDNISDELIKAVQLVMSGKKYINYEVAEILATSYEEKSKVELHENLSDREFEIFKLLMDGHSMTNIANALSVSVNTIRTHKVHILKKMHMQSDADIIKYGLQHNML